MGLNLTDLRRHIAQVVSSVFPWIRDGLAFERYARVVAVNAGDGTSDAASSVHTVDVRPLTPDLVDDPSWPEIGGLVVPVVGAAGGAGVYALPAVGAIVRIGFAYGRATHPYITDPLPWGFAVPEGMTESTVVVRDRNGVEIRISSDGITLTAGDRAVVVNSTTVQLGAGPMRRQLATRDWVEQRFETHSHPMHGSPPTPSPVLLEPEGWFTSDTEAS